MPHTCKDVVHVGNSTGKPAGITPVTRFRTRQHPYNSTRGLSHQNESKNGQISPEMSEILLISMNFTNSAITHSILVGKLCSWTRFEGDGQGYRCQ